MVVKGSQPEMQVAGVTTTEAGVASTGSCISMVNIADKAGKQA
jgi:hypothetical protein